MPPIQNNKKVSTKPLLVIYLIVLITMPLFHGGERLIEFTPFISIIFLLLAYSFTINTSKHNDITYIKWPLTIFIFWMGYLVFSTIVFQERKGSTNNLNINNLYMLLCFFTYFSIFVLTLLLVKSKKDVRKVAQALFTISFILSIYSLINHYTNGLFTFNSSLVPYSLEDWSKRVRGQFSYHAHYSAFLNLTIPLGVALSYDNYKQNRKINRSKKKQLLMSLSSTSSIYIFGSLLMILTLIKTDSRAGNASFLIATISSFLIISMVNFKTFNYKKFLTASFVGIFLMGFIILTTSFTDSLISRYIKDGTDLHGRQFAYSTAVKIIKKEPIFGVGLGNYSALAKQNKPFEAGITNRTIKHHAMNDYLEFTAEQGLIGLLFFIALIFTSMIKIIPLIKFDQATFPYLTATICSIFAILIHSAGDFIIQSPVISVYFFVLLALGLKCSSLQSCNNKRS